MILRSIRSNNWLALPVMGLLLALVAAPMLSRMDCLISGRSTFAIGSMEDCCPLDEHGGQATIDATCCEYAEASPVKDGYLPSMPVGIDVQTMMALAPLFAVIPEAGKTLIDPLASRPPPLAVPLRLAHISRLLL